MADFKKGGNAFGFAATLVLVGGVLWLLGWVALGKLPDGWVLGRLFSLELVDFGKFSLVFGALGLLVALPGAFVELNTHGSVTGVIAAAGIIGCLTVFLAFLSAPFILVYEPPWLYVFVGLISLCCLLVLSSFFLYSARLPDERPDKFARILEAAIKSGKVSMFRSKNTH